MVYLPADSLTHPAANRAWHSVTLIIEINELPLHHAVNKLIILNLSTIIPKIKNLGSNNF